MSQQKPQCPGYVIMNGKPSEQLEAEHKAKAAHANIIATTTRGNVGEAARDLAQERAEAAQRKPSRSW